MNTCGIWHLNLGFAIIWTKGPHEKYNRPKPKFMKNEWNHMMSFIHKWHGKLFHTTSALHQHSRSPNHSNWHLYFQTFWWHHGSPRLIYPLLLSTSQFNFPNDSGCFSIRFMPAVHSFHRQVHGFLSKGPRTWPKLRRLKPPLIKMVFIVCALQSTESRDSNLVMTWETKWQIRRQHCSL